MPDNKPLSFLNEFTVFGAFLAVAGAGILFGAFMFGKSYFYTEAPYIPEPEARAPQIDEYRSQAVVIMTPFLSQALRTDTDVAHSKDALLADLVAKTAEHIVVLRVPGEERDAHLGFVLLLDSWKRAMAGTKADQDSVVARTQELVASYPWIFSPKP